MSNSKLVSYTKISPHRTSPRNDKIRKITIHHMAGNLSVETCGNVFQSRKASANYGIGTDGRVGQYVDEADRAWSTATPDNDHQAINIEVANDGGAPDWHVSDAALASLVELCVDICQRNGIDKLTYTGDATGNLTRHNMFVPTACPGPYLQSKFPWIAQEVNARLGAQADKPAANSGAIVKGCVVRLKQGAKTYGGGNLDSFVYERDHVVSEISGDRCVITYGGVTVAAVRKSDLTLVSGGATTSKPTTSAFTPYTVKVSVTELRIRSGPGTDNASKGFIKPGVYTIVEESSGQGATKWGRLKSGAGWISLDYVKRLGSAGGSTSTGGSGSQAFKPYTVKVSVTQLIIRSGPGTNNSSKGYIKPGVYTIVEESSGQGATKWGRLKSGAGWISLDYATKC